MEKDLSLIQTSLYDKHSVTANSGTATSLPSIHCSIQVTVGIQTRTTDDTYVIISSLGNCYCALDWTVFLILQLQLCLSKNSMSILAQHYSEDY